MYLLILFVIYHFGELQHITKRTCEEKNVTNSSNVIFDIVNKNTKLKMEKHLDRVMEEIVSAPGVTGCVFVDHQGLCLGAKGTASTESAGIISAIAEQVGKLEPQNRAPVVVFENDSSLCVIQRNGTITGAVYKDIKN